MPIEFRTCLNRDFVYAKWIGRVTLDEFKENYFNYISDPHYRAGRTELVDQRDFVDFIGDFAMIKSALSYVNAKGQGPVVRTRTIVLTPPGGVFGLGRMYQQLADQAQGIMVDVFTSTPEALAALDLPYETLEEMLAGETFTPVTATALIAEKSDQ